MMKQWIMLMAMVVVGMPSLATPIAYDEGVDGDLPQNYSDHTPPFSLAPGDNTISGTITFGYTSDFDSFRFTFDAGNTVTSITYDIVKGTQGGNGDITSTQYFLYQGSTYLDDTLGISIPSIGNNFFSSSLPLSSDVYGLRETGINGYASGTSDYHTANYIWHIFLEEGAPIPEPTSLLLLGTGLGVLGLAAYRRKRK